MTHNVENFKARVLYDFNKINNLIWLKFITPVPDLERDVMITCREGKWADDLELSSKYPAVYEQLMGKLQNIFKELLRMNSQRNSYQ